MIKVTVEADIPENELETFLHMIRTFDLACPACHFRIVSSGGEMSTQDVRDMLERVGVPIRFVASKQ